ncbi:MAG TPA: hypothetical protein VMG39_09305 [Pseudolabrys sp.]|nr:hypothetical protein [Pseudolabrys sp.]
MSETIKTAPAAEPAAQAPTFMQKLSRWVTIAAGLVLGLVGLLKVYNAFVPQLPSCDDSKTADVIRGIFQQKDIALTKLTDLKLANESGGERNCTAHIETASETATISYSLTLQGKEFQVRITKVDAKPL